MDEVKPSFRITNRCPKCRGQSFDVDTTVQLVTNREFVDGILVFKTESVGMHDDIASFGRCNNAKCGHRWRFRNPGLDEVST